MHAASVCRYGNNHAICGIAPLLCVVVWGSLEGWGDSKPVRRQGGPSGGRVVKARDSDWVASLTSRGFATKGGQRLTHPAPFNDQRGRSSIVGVARVPARTTGHTPMRALCTCRQANKPSPFSFFFSLFFPFFKRGSKGIVHARPSPRAPPCKMISNSSNPYIR